MSDMLDTRAAWLSESDLESARERVPMVYVDAVPVRTDERGQVTTVGLLLRGLPDGSISRAVVSGRVLYGERVRDALLRHLEKDLGPMALPQVPTSPTPFTIVEYFPDETVTGFHDPRQHAVSLAYVVYVRGNGLQQRAINDFPIKHEGLIPGEGRFQSWIAALKGCHEASVTRPLHLEHRSAFGQVTQVEGHMDLSHGCAPLP